MESNYDNKDFEQYVKQNADQFRMFPSDKVWKGINNAVHTRRKWYGLWLGFLLLVTGGAVSWVMTIYPSSKKDNSFALNNNPASALSAKIIDIKKVSREFENLLPFNKEPAITQKNNLTPEPEIMSGALLQSIQNNIPEKTIYNPVVLQQYPGIQTEKNQPVIAGLINIKKNIINSLTETIPAGIEKNYSDNQNAFISENKTVKRRDEVYFPLTIESITNAYQFKKAAKRISWQLFITPTVSYRKLSVNKSLDNPSSSNYPFASLTDINSAVTHKPDMGLQIGASGRYPLTRNLKLRGGVQFNINRYDIKAYSFNGEVATIDLNGGGNGNNTISTWTYYRNYAGYKSNWLKNYYFSVSAPIGLEMKLLGNKKTYLGIAGTLQPTYVLNDRAYLISTDYKNYAEVPRLIRHVNLNTSFETFVNYTNGKTNWQVGPQVRYQILSSFHNTYPVKENLFDFGIKVGVTLNE